MKELGVQDLLRYALSGAIALAALLLTHPAAFCVVGEIEAAKEVTLILGSILLIGTLIYNLHRAIIYPVLLRVVGLIVLPADCSWQLLNFWKPSEAELEVDRWRWNLEEKRRKRWDEWGAQTHFLYCASWAIVAAVLVGNYSLGEACARASHLIWSLASVIFIAGLVSNYRLLYSIVSDRGSIESSHH